MKTCTYCGKENSDEAEACGGCGTKESKTAISAPPVIKSIKCDYCGVESEIVAAFRKVPRSFSHKFKWTCPDCFVKQKTKLFRRKLEIYGAIAAAGLAGLLFDASRPFGLIIFNFLLWNVFMILSILPHELGHALVAKLVGFRVFRIVVGSGKALWRRNLLGFKVVINSIPFGGATFVTPKEPLFFKWKYFLMILAGPGTNLIIASIAYLIMSKVEILAGSNGLRNEDPVSGFLSVLSIRLVPLHLIFLSNVLILLVNLWPQKIRSVIANGEISNDGLALIKAPFLSTEITNGLLAAYYHNESQESHEAKDDKAARKWCEEGLSKYPENVPLLNLRGLILIRLRRYVEGRECFEKLVERSAQNPGLHALLINNVAYADVLTGRAELLEEADRYSKQALARFPWNPSFKGTRGAVLVELGQVDQGIALLQEAMQNHEDFQNQAVNAAHIAFAERKKGNVEESKRYLESARALDPDCYLLKQMETQEPQ